MNSNWTEKKKQKKSTAKKISRVIKMYDFFPEKKNKQKPQDPKKISLTLKKQEHKVWLV